jgi:AraC-like DNA-binding protein/mannose-6-phosphate isomerase-like protein (cupin superfamily)
VQAAKDEVCRMSQDSIDIRTFFPITDEQQNRLLRQQPLIYRDHLKCDRMDSPFHSHDGYEMIYVHSGRGMIVLKDRIFPIASDTLYLIDVLELHKIRTDGSEPYVRSVINFTPEFLRSWSKLSGGVDLLQLFRHPPAHRVLKEASRTLPGFDGLCDVLRERSERHAMTAGLQLAALNLLYEIYEYMIDRFPESEKTALSQPEQHVENIIKYIELHYHEELTIDRLAKELYLSKYYISHIFQQVTGQTFQTFLLLKRINEAKRLLLKTNLSVLHIANQVGFASPAYFSSVFKQYNGMSPLKFRKQSKRSD